MTLPDDAAYEQQTLRKGFAKFNPIASQQVAELEAEQVRRRGQAVCKPASVEDSKLRPNGRLVVHRRADAVKRNQRR